MTESLRHKVADLYRQESGRVLATMIRQCGDFELAEDALQEAFTAAWSQWQRDGVPDNPRAWLFTTARFKLIDALRRRRAEAPIDDSLSQPAFEIDLNEIEDDRLRLIFICCHPALSPEAQVALTLREVCGLTTDEIARAFLVAPSSLAQRIVRAKARIRDEKIPYDVPAGDELPARLDAVLRVTYLVYNEGYYASSGTHLTRVSLSEEAIRLGRIVISMLPHSEALGLLALMLLQESRRAARTDLNGDIVLLEDQDRSLWDRRQAEEGIELAQMAMATPGPYAVQAAIAAVHVSSPTPSETNWGQIVSLYDTLLEIHRSSVVELNRAVAVAMRDGPSSGLAIVEDLLRRGGLADYGLAHAARADFCRRLGNAGEARASYRRARELATQEPEKRFLEKRLRELS